MYVQKGNRHREETFFFKTIRYCFILCRAYTLLNNCFDYSCVILNIENHKNKKKFCDINKQQFVCD